MGLYSNFMDICFGAYKPCSSKDGTCLDQLCLKSCHNQNTCVECMTMMFWNEDHKKRRYACIPITYTYALRFTNKNASEIYHILERCDEIKEKRVFTSLGCGPSTELFGIGKFLQDNNESNDIYYFGFDDNKIWSQIQEDLKNKVFFNTNVRTAFTNTNLLERKDVLEKTDVLILNYVVSDIYKHTGRKSVVDFLNNYLTEVLENLPYGSYIIINDTNSYNMGRDEIENWVDYQQEQMNIDFLEKGCFTYPKRNEMAKFDNNHFIKENNFIFDDNIKYRDFRDNIYYCSSCYAILRKFPF